MDQPWWVYGAIALCCALLYLAAQVVESKYMKEEDALDLFKWVVAILGVVTAFKAVFMLNLFG